MNSFEIREKFIDYFKSLKHKLVNSSSLIPINDSTLLFTNAGMNQFKDALLGLEKLSFKNAVSIQKCLRAGGKHNDLDAVGFTARHLTFFEMMGNFSFGEYFKKEAIVFAWNFLTKELKLEQSQLYVSVYFKDTVAADIWKNIMNIPEEKIFKLDLDNFWQMGDTGPCGPCSEIFFDRGENFGCKSKNCNLACGCDRFLEVWNLVFMEYEKTASGELLPLKQKGIDTGMGLERLCAVLQNAKSIFESDLFAPILKKIETCTVINYNNSTPEIKAAFNVIADHVRAATLLISDGCAPSNEGRGYVLRKIIRRALLFSKKLTAKNIFPEVAENFIEFFASIYSELKTNKKLILSVLNSETTKFSENLTRGKALLENYFENLNKTNNKILDGELIFKLYDTYGFPIEITELIAKENGFKLDKNSFDLKMNEQKIRSNTNKFKANTIEKLEKELTTEFTGYDSLIEKSKITGIFDEENNFLSTLTTTETAWIVTEKTPFFVAKGGQVNDIGLLKFNSTNKTNLLDLKKIDTAILMKIQAPCNLKINDTVELIVDLDAREKLMRNHTATHLLQAALRSILGNSVKQAGSVVEFEYLRFDFTYHEKLTSIEIASIENLVNKKIRENIKVIVENTNYNDALKKGALAIFGEKYNLDSVRAIIISDFSNELCGGTHCKYTGQIGAFKIIEESSIAAGQRRIVAITGEKSIAEFQTDFNLIKSISSNFKIKKNEIELYIKNLIETHKLKEQKIEEFKNELFQAHLNEWCAKIKAINNIPFLFLKLKNYSILDLKKIATLIQAQKPGFYFLISNNENKLFFYTEFNIKLENKICFNNLSEFIKNELYCTGGGKKNNLQGNCNNFNLDFEALITKWLTKNI